MEIHYRTQHWSLRPVRDMSQEEEEEEEEEVSGLWRRTELLCATPSRVGLCRSWYKDPKLPLHTPAQVEQGPYTIYGRPGDT